MWPWVYTAVSSGSDDQPRTLAWLCAANGPLPVSTSTRPSSTAKAAMLPNDGTNAIPGPTSSSSPSKTTGLTRAVDSSPRSSRSVRSRT